MCLHGIHMALGQAQITAYGTIGWPLLKGMMREEFVFPQDPRVYSR